MVWNVAIDDTFQRANSATVGNGWTDQVGGIWSINNNTLVGSTTDAAGYFHDFLTRPSSEASQDQRITWHGVYGASATGVFGAVLRWQVASGQTAASSTYYLFGFSEGKGSSNVLNLFRVVNGTGPSIGVSSTFGAIADGTPLIFDASVTGINPTTITFSVTNASTNAVLSTVTTTDSQAALQSATGVPGLATWLDTGSGPGVTRITEATTYIPSANSIALPNDPGISYSPFNWVVTNAQAKSINPGAYFTTLFSGTSCTLLFNTANNKTPLSQLAYSIDGQAWISAEVASTLALTMPTNTATWPKHTLEVVFKSMSLYLDSGSNPGGTRWASPQNTALVLTGIQLDAGASLTAMPQLPRTVAVFGDSITEGFKTITGANTSSGQKDTDASDARLAWSYKLRAALGAEVGVIGFSGQGLTKGGNVDVPVFPQTVTNYWAGQPRTIGNPDLILIVQGGNDGSAVGDTNFIAAYVGVLQTLLAATSTTVIACTVLYFQNKIQDITTAVQQVNHPRVRIINSVGLYDMTLSPDNTHPFGVAGSAIAEGFGNRLRPLISGVTRPWSYA